MARNVTQEAFEAQNALAKRRGKYQEALMKVRSIGEKMGRKRLLLAIAEDPEGHATPVLRGRNARRPRSSVELGYYNDIPFFGAAEPDSPSSSDEEHWLSESGIYDDADPEKRQLLKVCAAWVHARDAREQLLRRAEQLPAELQGVVQVLREQKRMAEELLRLQQQTLTLKQGLAAQHRVQMDVGQIMVTIWRTKQNLEALSTSLDKKLAEVAQVKEQQRFMLEDASCQQMVQKEKMQLICQEKRRISQDLQKLQAEQAVAQQVAEALEAEVQLQQQSVQALSDELARHQGAVLAQILRRATLPEQRPRRAVELASLAKMDWCCITAAASGRPTSLSIEEFMDTPECGIIKELSRKSGAEYLYWFPSNDNKDGRYLRLNGRLYFQLHSPVYRSPPMKLNFFELLRASLGDSQFADLWLVPEAPHFHQKALGLDRVKDIEAPLELREKLRPYQLGGMRWLATLTKNGLGAVLADDMGLGKTLQCISVLLYMKENKFMVEDGVKRPFLVVVPPGLLRNWQNEFQRWAPSLVVHTHYGPKRVMPSKDQAKDFDVLLTTYELVRNDRKKFADARVIGFSGMVIDEAQKIKNHHVQVSQAVKEVGNAIGHTRIALSGTPIENKVDELHSIFDFVNFGYLGDQETFSRSFSRIIEKGRDPEQRKEALELLKRLTGPFQMRRLKTDPNILPDLPAKQDMASSTTLSKEQEKLYAAIQEDFRNTMVHSRQTTQNHNFERRGHIFAMLERVRRVCAHPLCLEKAKYPESCKTMTVAAGVEGSGKTQRLVELLEEIVPAQEKAVVFATRKEVIRVLHQLISKKFGNVEVLIFTGDLSLQERNNVQQRFQTEARCQVLLITLQCGGIGLNLTAANHVIHFDRCYNPAKEAQATDRCHRLGQKRMVCVHRLITAGTYEEQLEKIMARKQDLSDLTVTRAEDWIADYDDEALFDLFMLRTGVRRQPTSVALETPPRPEHPPQPAPKSTPKKRARPSSSGPAKRAKGRGVRAKE